MELLRRIYDDLLVGQDVFFVHGILRRGSLDDHIEALNQHLKHGLQSYQAQRYDEGTMGLLFHLILPIHG